MNADALIETCDLSKRYGDFPAVTNLSLRVRSNRITGFVGRNGAGKSSTIKMLLGMVAPTSGNGRVFGLRIDAPKESLLIRQQVAYVGDRKSVV